MADVKRPKVDKEYVQIFKSLLVDVERLTGLDMARDSEEIQNRVANEGLSFLTKTLPSFYKHILECVECGRFFPVAGFKTMRSGPLPKFLQGLVCGLFENNGSLRKERLSPYLGHIGQICTIMYKCEFPYTLEQEMKRLEKFMEVESELPETIKPLPFETETILRNAIDFGLELFRDFSLTELPRMGPGAVADRAKAQEKYDFVFSDRIDDVFPYHEWFYVSRTTDEVDSFTGHLVQDRGLQKAILRPQKNVSRVAWANNPLPPSRGIFVNKDSRGPRYISAEAKELMWIQQAVGRSIMDHLERHPLSRGHVNFSDQTINGALALSSSVDGKLATVDLEDASDRVSLALVRLLLPSNLVRLLEASRSNCAVLPVTGRAVRLKKFAPMGSACCFPVESVVFYLLASACVAFVTGKEFGQAKKSVYVYGDDIIVPGHYVSILTSVLEDLHLKVNKKKTFSIGPFRESCGVDAIDGYDITPIKMRRPAPRSRDDVSSLISWTDMSNQLFYAGYWVTADAVASIVKRHVSLPYVPYQSGLLGLTGLYSLLGVSGRKLKWDRKYQHLRVKVRAVSAPLDDWGFDVAPLNATLHSHLSRDYSGHDDRGQGFGRSSVSTLSPDTLASLSLRYRFQWLF